MTRTLDPPEIRIELIPLADPNEAADRWRELEQRADCSFFQTWTWTGCLARERFPRPVLLEARSGDRIVGLALWNRRARLFGQERLFLGETGDLGWDSVFIEHNGILLEEPADPVLLADCLRAAGTAPIGSGRPSRRALCLSGVPDHYIDSGPTAWNLHNAIRDAPWLDLNATRNAGRTFLEGLSANTRYQIRRSDRRYGGPDSLRLQRAETIGQARDFLAEMATLHQAAWIRRGKPGAFSNPRFTRFHEQLVVDGVRNGTVDLLRVSSSQGVVGILYNFRFRQRVYAYQSGFAFDTSDSAKKPGYTCHRMAIEYYMNDGATAYDFLAGSDRYKTSLANSSLRMRWLGQVPRWSPAWFGEQVRSQLATLQHMIRRSRTVA